MYVCSGVPASLQVATIDGEGVSLSKVLDVLSYSFSGDVACPVILSF